MSNIKPDEDGNYTEKQWDNLPVAKRMRLCASGEYEIQRSDMTDAADRIEKLEAELVRTFNTMMGDAKRIETLEAALREIVDALRHPKGGQHVYDMRNASYIARKALERKE
jgi:hypothetical protein